MKARGLVFIFASNITSYGVIARVLMCLVLFLVNLNMLATVCFHEYHVDRFVEDKIEKANCPADVARLDNKWKYFPKVNKILDSYVFRRIDL